MVGRVKVLVIAEEANPEWASVPLVGWSHAQALREVADVHLVTHVRNRDAIKRAGLLEGKDFTVIDSEAVDAPLYRLATLIRGSKQKGWSINTAMQSIRIYYFQHLVWRHFADSLRNGEYQIVHQITPLSPTAPSLLAARLKKVGVHFIWGPINGGLPWPAEFNLVRKKEREWLSKVRNVYKLLPGYHGVRKHASALLIASEASWDQMPARYHEKCIYIPENGIDRTRFNKHRTREYSTPLRVGFVGRLVPYKGGDMLIEALASLAKSGRLTIDFFGDGPERENLEAMVESKGLGKVIQFHGNVEHTQLQDNLVACDVLGFPSIREFGGGVVLEAMALGVVPAIVGYGGPNELVTEGTGFRIPIGSRNSIIEGFRLCFEGICNNPSLLAEMSINGRARIDANYTWKAKANQVLEVYKWVLEGSQKRKPCFGLRD